jgi:2'-5' RNA ligase
MPFSVELNFDPAAEARVRALWRELADAGLCTLLPDIGARPHLSVSVYDTADPDRLRQAVERVARRSRQFELHLKAVGVFPGGGHAVYLVPTVTLDLLRLHQAFHAEAGPLGIAPWPHYLPGSWVPHCTVALEMPAERIPAIVERCLSGGALGPATVREISVIEFRPVRTHACVPVGVTS